MKIKFFLFLITLQLSFISTFFTSNIALAAEQQKNTTQPNQVTPSLNEKQLPDLTQSNSDPQQKSIDIKTDNNDNPSENSPSSYDPITVSIIGALTGALTGALAGALGTLGINWFQNHIDDKKQRKANTFELAKDWDSLSLRESRTLAWNVFSETRREDKSLYFNHYYDRDGNDKKNAINLLRIIDFFERLSFLYEANQIDEKLAKIIFGKAYTVWHYECFKPQHIYMIDENNDVKPDLRFTFNIIDSLEEWLLNPIESQDVSIKTEEEKHLDQYIEKIYPVLYQQLYKKQIREKIQTEIVRNKQLKDKQLQYIIDFPFSEPIESENITIKEEEKKAAEKFIKAISSTLYQELDQEDKPDNVQPSTEIRKKIANGNQLQYTIDVSFTEPKEDDRQIEESK